MSDTKKKLYALLVGIDQYQPNVPIMPGCQFGPLAGCVNDANTMLSYLKAEDGFELHFLFLKNGEATKEAVSGAMRTHLGQAGENDVALFYYSGHGIQEYADPELWREETDGRLECLVCYNETADKPCLLADKELRYLIHEIAAGPKAAPKQKPPHILTMFDCCHSGDNTRNGFMSNNDTRERRIKCVAPQRNWSDYVFKDDLNVSELKSKPLSQTLPEGIHLHLSACESDESALEVNGKGVFTSYLINILKRARGNITYYDLMSQVRHYLKNTFVQKPQLRLPGEDSSGNFAIFLNKSVAEQPLYGNVIYNYKNGWILDMGSLMGISQQTRSVEVTGSNGESFSARIQRILPDETWLKFRPADTPDPKQVYQATVEGIMAHPVKLFVNNYDGNVDSIRLLLEKFQENTQNIVLEEAEEKADYSLQIRGFSYYITKPGDPFRPLIKPVAFDDPDAIGTLVNYLRHISQWEYVRRLKNAHTYLFRGNPITVEAFLGGQNGSPIEMESGTINLHPQQQTGGKWGGKVALKLTNNFSKKLYVSALYLPIEFRVYLKGIEPQVYGLEAGESIWLFNYRQGEISFSIDEIARNYNWPSTEDYFKIIVSTTPFDVARLEKRALPKPALLSDDHRETTKGLDIDEPEPALEGDDWITQEVTLKFHNPLFNKVEKDTLLEMLTVGSMSGFATQLFFEENEGFELKLREKIQLDGGAAAIGTVEKFAAGKYTEFLAQTFKKRKGLFTNFKTMVSLGDRWLHDDSVRNLSARFSGYYNVLPIKGTFEKADELEKQLSGIKGQTVVISLGLENILNGKTASVLERIEKWVKLLEDSPVMVHGYDYFDEQQTTRSAIDQFNESLKALSGNYPNLKHIDLRGSLKPEQWASETLPNEDGFEKLAGQFLALLK